MDKSARLSAIQKSIAEYKEKEAQARYGIELNIKTKEYEIARKCFDMLVLVDEAIRDLEGEAKHLTEEIDDESREVI